MYRDFPPAVPEVPVTDIAKAAAYYEKNLGFKVDWVAAEYGLAGISKGECRIFLSNSNSVAPVVIWLNLNSKQEVDDLHQTWKRTDAEIVSPPEDKPWNLSEFTAKDPDGNRLRVFYDFSLEQAVG